MELTPDKNVEISKFDWSPWMKKNPFIIVAGARGSGKSIMVRDIVHQFHLDGVPRCVIFSQTEGASGFFSNFVPGIFIHTPVTISDITAMWEAQQELAMKKRIGQIPAETDIRLVIVADDCAYNKKIIGCNALRNLTMNGRHSDAILIMTLQYVYDLNGAMRDSADIAVFMNDGSKKARVRIYESFASCFPKFSVFNAAFSMCTANHEAFVVNRKGNTNDISSCISYYKAKYDLNFKFGSPSLWNYHQKHFMSPEEEFILKQQRSKNTSSVAMSKQIGDTIHITRV